MKKKQGVLVLILTVVLIGLLAFTTADSARPEPGLQKILRPVWICPVV